MTRPSLSWPQWGLSLHQAAPKSGISTEGAWLVNAGQAWTSVSSACGLGEWGMMVAGGARGQEVGKYRKVTQWEGLGCWLPQVPGIITRCRPLDMGEPVWFTGLS